MKEHTPITIRGASFEAGASVHIRGAQGDVCAVLSPTELTAKTPKAEPRRHEVACRTVSGVERP